MKTLAICAAALVLIGCASTPRDVSGPPVVDLRGRDVALYDRELQQCNELERKNRNYKPAVGAAIVDDNAQEWGFTKYCLAARGYKVMNR